MSEYYVNSFAGHKSGLYGAVHGARELYDLSELLSRDSISLSIFHIKTKWGTKQIKKFS